MGIGVWLTSGGLPVPSPIPVFYWVGIGLMCLGIVTILVGLLRKTEETAVHQERFTTKNIVRVLTKIHKRMLKLKDKASKQYRLEHDGKQFLALHQELMVAMDKDNKLQELQESYKGKKLSKVQIKRRKQIDSLHETTQGIVPIDVSLDGLVQFIDTFNRLAQSPNKQFQALDILRGKDKGWNKLFTTLQDIKIEYGDATLNTMIDDYVRWSYGGSGLILHTDLLRWYIPPQCIQSQFLGSPAYNPSIEIENKITWLREKIVGRVKELKAMDNKDDKTVIKDTKIKLDVEKSDKARGLEIIDTPTDLEDVQVEVTAKGDVKDVSAVSIVSHDATPLSTGIIGCECGYFIRYASACGTRSSISCPQCGKVHEIKS